MKAVLMAAGKSTRTYPLTLTRPKPLLKVANKQILEHQLDALQGIVDTVVVIVGYRKEMIKEAFGDHYSGLRIEYVEQEEQLGTGHAILQCAGRINEPFLAMNGDDLYDPKDLRALAKADHDAGLVKEVDDPRLYGIYKVASDGRVVRLVEKPEELFSKLANVGAYKFSPDVFDVLGSIKPSPRGEIEITSAVQRLAEKGDFRVVRAQGYWLPIGYPWHLLDANDYLLRARLQPDMQGEVSPDAHTEGVVSVGPGTVVRLGVLIEGPVFIGADCTIGPNCWLRPGTSIGDHCRVGHGVEIKNSILMDGARVPHLSYVGDSVIGEGANLGCGTVTANVRHDGTNVRSMVKGELLDTGRRKLGTIIGDNVHTGIHTSIYPGRKLWPHTTTLPNEVVRKDIVKEM